MFIWLIVLDFIFSRPGSDLLFHTLRCSTISAEAFNGRVRDGIGFRRFAIATKPAKDKIKYLTNGENENNQVNRTISTGKLHTLLRFHIRPINVVVFHDSQGKPGFEGASRLDAFSGYPVHT